MNRRYMAGSSCVRIRRFARMIAAVVPLLAAPIGSVRGQLLELENDKVYGFALFDILEIAPGLEGRPARWDMIGSIGKEYNRFWIKSEGDLSTSTRTGELEFQALYSRLIAPFWEAQVGVRLDVGYEGGETRTRGQFVLGLEGLAPYWFELEPAVFVSQDGDISAALLGSYDLFVTQRMILQPRVEANVAVQDVEEWGISSGLNSVGLGARLRYEIRREFAPYVGLNWTRLTGGTADLARVAEEDFNTLGFVAGFRVWR